MALEVRKPIPESEEELEMAKKEVLKAIKEKMKDEGTLRILGSALKKKFQKEQVGEAHEKRSLLGGDEDEEEDEEEGGMEPKVKKEKKDPWVEWMKKGNKKLDFFTFTKEMLASGSKVSENQFLAFNIYYPKMKPAKEFPSTEYLDEAKQLLANFKDFRNYIHRLGSERAGRYQMCKRGAETRDLGVFKDVHRAQLEILGLLPAEPRIEHSSASTEPMDLDALSIHDPSERPSLDDTEIKSNPRTEENTVNVALVQLLRALLGPFEDRISWSYDRNALRRVKFTTQSMKCELDGYLTVDGHGSFPWKDAFAIVETKRSHRSRMIYPEVYRQEGSELVNWIKNDNPAEPSALHPRRTSLLPAGGRRMLISQDRDRIFASFAYPTQEYIDFLNLPKADRAYLEVQEYGPFRTGSASNMKYFAWMMVDHCLNVLATLSGQQ